MYYVSRNGNLSQCGDAPTSSVCRGDVDGLVACAVYLSQYCRATARDHNGRDLSENGVVLFVVY